MSIYQHVYMCGVHSYSSAKYFGPIRPVNHEPIILESCIQSCPSNAEHTIVEMCTHGGCVCMDAYIMHDLYICIQ